MILGCNTLNCGVWSPIAVGCVNGEVLFVGSDAMTHLS